MGPDVDIRDYAIPGSQPAAVIMEGLHTLWSEEYPTMQIII